MNPGEFLILLGVLPYSYLLYLATGNVNSLIASYLVMGCGSLWLYWREEGSWMKLAVLGMLSFLAGVLAATF